MILLDTNVLSEFMRPRPAVAVAAWLDRHATETLYVCTVSLAEIELGLALMPAGRRQAALAEAATAMFAEDFAGRCLPFDEAAAYEYGRIVAHRTRIGRPISVEDAQIAAISHARGMTLATRNIADFRQIEGLTVVDPWQD